MARLEYGGLAMIVEDLDGKWMAQTFNEMNYLRHCVESPASNPYRNIEGYYEDLSWSVFRKNKAMQAKAPSAVLAMRRYNQMEAEERKRSEVALLEAQSSNVGAESIVASPPLGEQQAC